LKCLVCQKITILPLSKPVQLKPTKIQNDNVETPVKNKKKKKKKKDTYAGLNSSVISVYTPKRELSHLKREKKTKKENEPADISSSMQPSVMPQEEQSQSRRRRRKARESPNGLELYFAARQKVKKVKSTVREQIAEAKQQIIASRKKEKERIALELENTAKKARKCDALRNILTDTSSQSTRPTLKEFLASLN
jgi:hypothetical protein